MRAAIGATRPGPTASLPAIARACLTISLFGFGGGIVWARRIAVERRRWLSDAEFLDIVSLCQFLPGPNVFGIALCIGAKMRGAVGALAAIAGFLLVPWAVGLALGIVCLEYAHTPLLHNILGGISATAAGMLVGTGLRLFLPQRRRPAAIAFAAAALALIAFSRLPLLLVLSALAPLSIAAAAIAPARAR